GEVDFLPDAVEHNEIVAEAVHLGEAELRHRSLNLQCAHGPRGAVTTGPRAAGQPKAGPAKRRSHTRYPGCVALNALYVRWSSIFAPWVALAQGAMKTRSWPCGPGVRDKRTFADIAHWRTAVTLTVTNAPGASIIFC